MFYAKQANIGFQCHRFPGDLDQEPGALFLLGKMVVRLKPPFKERIVVSREKVSLLKEWLDY